jgi:signal transduction histidine kinase
LVGTVSWAGEPTKTKAYGPLGDRLSPRKSFAAWTETVKGRSRPWGAVEIESATALRSAIVVADLERRVAQRTKALEDANGALQSIVEQRERLIDELKHAELVKDEFVSTVNHELRTPLTAIFGALRLLGATSAGKLDPKSERLLEVAQISCNQLTALVNDILDIEKIAAGKIDYQMETLPAGPLIQGIIVRNSAIADAYGVHFKTLLKLEGLALRVDPNRFSQAFVNLLSNAAKYSPLGGVVSIVAKRNGEGAIRISVTDQGPGIPKAFRSKIFGRFAQADNSTTRQVGGSGLGLNITKSLIEAFGGTVSFDSVEGRGATFHFILPCYNSTTTELELQAHG